MALPSCRRCGTQDPQRMYGLMSLWFAPLTELDVEGGYFHLCPDCHDEVILPELERVQNRILELHPAAARSLAEDHTLAPDPNAASAPEGQEAAQAEGDGSEPEAADRSEGPDEG